MKKLVWTNKLKGSCYPITFGQGICEYRKIIRATETTLEAMVFIFLSLDTLFDVSIAQPTHECDAVSLQLSALSV